LATVSAAFAAAIFLAQYVLTDKLLPFCAAISAIFALIGLFLRGNARLRVILLCFGLAFGFLYNLGYSAVFHAPADALCGETRQVSATVCGYPEITGNGSRVVIRVKNDGAPSVKALLYVRGSVPDLLPGDVIGLKASFESAEELYGTETDYYSSRGLFLFAFTSDEITPLSHSSSLRYLPVRTSHALKELIQQVFPQSTAGFMQALLTGDRTLINADPLLSSAMQKSGISHVVSVSGMHIAFLLGFLMIFIKNRFRLTYRDPAYTLFHGVCRLYAICLPLRYYAYTSACSAAL